MFSIFSVKWSHQMLGPHDMENQVEHEMNLKQIIKVNSL